MPNISPSALRAQIARGAPSPVYLIVGDDSAEASGLAADLCGLVEEELRPFNVERLYGTDKVEPETIAQSARTVPLLGERRVVVVLRAEKLLKPKRRGKDDEAPPDEADDEATPADGLIAYIGHPDPQTTLVFVAEDVNKTTKLYKALQKHATIVECWGLRGGRDAKVDLRQAARQAEQLVKAAVSQAGQKIDPAAARLLAERAGTDISTLRGDLDRLLIYAAGKPAIDLADVQEVVSAETAQNDWAVADAIERSDAAGALKQVALVLDGGTAPEKLLGQLAWVVRDRLRDPRRIPQAIEAVFRTDLELKSTRAEARVLLERLVVELCRR